LFVLALPPFHSGYWVQAEPTTAALHLIGAGIACGLATACFRYPNLISRAIAAPAVVAPLAIAAIGIFASAFATVPSLALLGLPEIGEGPLWYLDCAMISAATIIAGRTGAGARRLRRAALGSGMALLFFSLPPVLHVYWGAVSEPAYIGIPAVAIPLLVYGLRRESPAAATIGVALLGLALALASTNKTAIALQCALVSVWFARSRGLLPPAISRAAAGALIALAPLTISGLVVAAGHLPGTQLYTLQSRARFYDLAVSALAADPWRLLTGYGWGHFGDILIAFGADAADRLVPIAGVPTAMWDALQAGYFHSHNIVIEGMLSGGILGAAASLAWFVGIAWACPRQERMASALGVAILAALLSMWFNQPATVPFVAMALAAQSSPRRFVRSLPRWPMAAALALVMLSLAVGSAVALRDIAIVDDYLTWSRPDAKRCPVLFPAPDRGGVELASPSHIELLPSRAPMIIMWPCQGGWPNWTTFFAKRNIGSTREQRACDCTQHIMPQCHGWSWSGRSPIRALCVRLTSRGGTTALRHCFA
jgi:hypothetical protein